MSSAVNGKVVVITGASSGFGAAMADVFGAAGAKLVLAARGADKLDKTVAAVKKKKGTAIGVPTDVTDTKALIALKDRTLSEYGQVDILINNAGGGVKIAPVVEQTAEDIDAAIELNLTSVINACRIFVPAMAARKSGLIINFTSVCERYAWPTWAVYSAAKAGLNMFSRALYTEVRPQGIAVTILCPGGSNTGFQQLANIDRFGWDDSQSLRPEHIADAALAVASMKPGAVVPEIIVTGHAQEIVPF